MSVVSGEVMEPLSEMCLSIKFEGERGMSLSCEVLKPLKKACFLGAYGLLCLLLIGASSAGAQTGGSQSPSSDTIGKQLRDGFG